MRRFTFPYTIRADQSKNPKENWNRTPLLKVRLSHEGKSLNYLALVDSGADLNIFHSDIAHILGIDTTKLKNKISFGGVTKSMTTNYAYLAMIEIGVENVSFITPVYFSPYISDEGFGILGQAGFFNNFKVIFDQRKYLFHLERD